MKSQTAIKKINQKGALLVFPINNNKEPSSLWAEFFPKTKMRWEWDDDGDNRVAGLWRLMKKLSDSGEVVYSKWYQGRATFFSKELFTALLRKSLIHFDEPILSRPARELLDCLESDSPLSTKQLKQMCELRGKDNEGLYNRSMKELFSKFLIVAYGEVDDGAFPSLAVGATRHLYEDLLDKARNMTDAAAQKIIDQYLPSGGLLRKYLDKNLKNTQARDL